MPEQIPLMVDAVTQELRQFTSDETIPRGQLLAALQVALTGLVTSNTSGVLESDTILQALGKLQAQTSNKVDKEAGKQLSTEDYTSAEKAKLSGLQDALNLKADNSAVAQAIAMAATFTTVPTTFQAWSIVVTQPHLRQMVWSVAKGKYVRAPWHQPGTLRHVYRDLRPGELEVRGDVVLQSADFPDLSEYLGVVGATFVLDEARGEFLRSLDSGRGKDLGRTVGSAQAQSIQSHTHPYYFIAYTTQTGSGVAFNGVTGLQASATGQINTLTAGTTETRPSNLAYRLAVTY